nr:DUF4440 domain-containing protein [Mesorhizobium sp.]
MLGVRTFCAAVLLMFTALMGAGASLAASAEDDVKAAYSAWDAAFNKGDAGAIAALYSDDALFLPPTHDVIKGPAGVEKFLQGIIGMGTKDHKFEMIEAREEGSIVYAAAKWSATGKDSEGKDQTWGGVATHVFERQSDGSLKVKLNTFN